jgi:hypothetical protein
MAIMVDMGYSKQLAGGGVAGAGCRIAPNGGSLAHNTPCAAHTARALYSALVSVTPPPRFAVVLA